MKQRKLQKDRFKLKDLPTEIIPEIEGLLNVNLKFLGEGTFSKIYSIAGKGAVIKITKDTKEISILQKIKQNNLEHLPKIYDIKKYKGFYLVVMERLYIDTKVKDDLRIIFGTRLLKNGDELDKNITNGLLQKIKTKKLKDKVEKLINYSSEIYISTLYRALAFDNSLIPWTKEYKKNKDEIYYILENFNKDEIKLLLKYISDVYFDLEPIYSNFILDIKNSIDDLLDIGVFHADVAIRNIMKRKDGRLILIDYNLAFTDDTFYEATANH